MCSVVVRGHLGWGTGMRSQGLKMQRGKDNRWQREGDRVRSIKLSPLDLGEEFGAEFDLLSSSYDSGV